MVDGNESSSVAVAAAAVADDDDDDDVRVEGSKPAQIMSLVSAVEFAWQSSSYNAPTTIGAVLVVVVMMVTMMIPHQQRHHHRAHRVGNYESNVATFENVTTTATTILI